MPLSLSSPQLGISKCKYSSSSQREPRELRELRELFVCLPTLGELPASTRWLE